VIADLTLSIWVWLAAVLAVWTLIILTALRWLQPNKEAGERYDTAMAGPHITEACDYGYHDSCLKYWCRCECHKIVSGGTEAPCVPPRATDAESPTRAPSAHPFSLGRADRPPSDPGDPS